MKKLEDKINQRIIEKSGIEDFVHISVIPSEVAHVSYLDFDMQNNQVVMKTFAKKVAVEKYTVSAKIPHQMMKDVKIDVDAMISNVLIQEAEVTLFKQIKKKIDLFAQKNYQKTYNILDKIKKFFNKKYVKRIKINSVEDLTRKILMESNTILRNGRRGMASYVICNNRTGALLQNSTEYVMMAETKIENHSLPYPIGIYAGIKFYVDPMMKFDDNTIYVCRKNYKEEPGIILAFHKEGTNSVLMSGIGNPEGEQTRSLIVKCAIAEIGEHPEVSYRKFVYKSKKLFM